jgi:hypothetical protein
MCISGKCTDGVCNMLIDHDGHQLVEALVQAAIHMRVLQDLQREERGQAGVSVRAGCRACMAERGPWSWREHQAGVRAQACVWVTLRAIVCECVRRWRTCVYV